MKEAAKIWNKTIEKMRSDDYLNLEDLQDLWSDTYTDLRSSYWASPTEDNKKFMEAAADRCRLFGV